MTKSTPTSTSNIGFSLLYIPMLYIDHYNIDFVLYTYIIKM